MKEWFNNLQTRERNLVLGAALVLAALIVYLLIWEPVTKKVAHLDSSVKAQQAQLTWMQQASQEIKTLQRGSSTQPTSNQGASLINAVERSAKETGINDSVTRTEPQGSNKITVELHDTEFDRLIDWIGILTRRYNARITQFNANRTDIKGHVDARFILSREAS
jgi:general secretion pathway protein M